MILSNIIQIRSEGKKVFAIDASKVRMGLQNQTSSLTLYVIILTSITLSLVLN